MKRIIFKITKLLFYGCLFSLIAIFLFYQYLISDWNQAYDIKGFEQLKEEIRKAPEMPDLYYVTMNKVYGKMTSTKNHLLYGLTGNRKSSCACLDVSWSRYYVIRKNVGIRSAAHVLSIKLEKAFTQKQCLNHEAQSFSFLMNNIGFKQAAKYYYEKELEKLTEDEFALLALMTKNPSLYNPVRFPERVEKKLKEFGYELPTIFCPPRGNKIKSN